MVEAADKGEDAVMEQEDESNTDDTFANLDAAGNIELEGSSDANIEDEISPTNDDITELMTEHIGEPAESANEMECSDKASDEVVSPTDIDVEIKSDGSDERMDDESPKQSVLDDDEPMDSCKGDKEGDREEIMDHAKTSVGDDSDDEFVDAEESYDPTDNSEKSEHIFLSASEASTSDRNLSASPEKAENLEIDISTEPSEVEEKCDRMESHQETKNGEKIDSETCLKPQHSAVKYEEPLDPAIYGGQLSARMSKESVWKEVWYVAKPIPIWQQKRLFDDTKEAERILHHFIQCEMRTVATLVMPSLLHAAYDRILDCPDSKVPFIAKCIDDLHRKLKDLQRYASQDTEIFQEIIAAIYKCELIASKYHSLYNKLSHQSPTSQQDESSRKMTELERRTRRNKKGPKLSAQPAAPEQIINEEALFEQLISSEAEIMGAARSPWGGALQRLFHAQQAASSRSSPTNNHPRQIPIFPLPIGREYILQTVTKHPSTASRDCLQRMFVAISGSEFRMAYANSSDKTFL